MSETSTQRVREWRKANPEKAKALWLRQRGVHRPAYEALLGKQGNVCAICGDAPKGKALAIDHDHETGTIRGLLCDHCNMGLGHFKDDPDLLLAAVKYLHLLHATGVQQHCNN